MTLSFASRVERGQSRQTLLVHTIRRAAIIFALGLVLNGFPAYDLATLRIPGVLQRIAVCYAIAGAIYLYTSLRGQIVATGALLTVYWVLMRFAPVPGFGFGVLVKNGNFAQYIDQIFLTGHMWQASGNWDPEGIVSTLPAIATMLFGIMAGHLLRSPRSPADRTVWMFMAGGALIIAGQILDNWLPINKNLWTSSYSMFTAGLAFQSFGAAYWITDVIGWRRGTRPLIVFGMNAIAAYVLSGLIARLASMSGAKAAIYDGALAPLLSPANASLAWALLNVAVCYAAVWLMYRRGWFIKV
jgi:predicted acyltransferase